MISVDPTHAEPHLSVTGASRCVLVVEDEAFLAALIEDILVSAGYRVLRAARVDTALQILLSGASIDAALLDIDVNGVEVFPVARKLREAGVPFVFASGYGREGMPPDFADYAVVQKPYLPDSITTALSRSLSASSSR